jgi:transcriptional regulator with XRE-family HTH domain
MDAQKEIREFLVSRRARLTPEALGLPDYGGRRRVAGLRREEVALVAGISVEYYTRLERGNATGVSESVLDGIGRALQLDDVEYTHLHDLVRAATASPGVPRRAARPARVTASVRQLMDAMKDIAVLVQNGRGDVVAWNSLGEALYSPMLDQAQRQPNFGRFVFLDPKSQEFYVNWEESARQTVALLRSEAGRAPNDRALNNLVGELSTRSDTFRALWAAHNVREHRTGMKEVHHPLVGEMSLSFEGLQLTSARGLLMLPYTAEPGSASYDKLQLLANWTAQHHAEASTPEAKSSVHELDPTL